VYCFTWDFLAELLLHGVEVLKVGCDGDGHGSVQAQPLESLQENFPKKK
jgi:hypothetical protein